MNFDGHFGNQVEGISMIRSLVLLLVLNSVPLMAQSQQIPAGSTSGLATGSPAPAATKKILHDALTAKTRAKLQEAMDSTEVSR
jgi:hypothetical protein